MTVERDQAPRLTGAGPVPTPLTGKGPRLRGPFLVSTALAALLSAATLFGAQEAKPAAQQAAPAQNQQQQAATYVGSDTCQGCHDEIFTAFQKNPHHIVETDKKRGWDTKACESCHGPGSKHAESTSPQDIINPAKLSATKADQDCLKCHLNQPTHVGRLRGGHGRNQIACVNCHSIHKGQEQLKPVKFADINKQCTSCHPSVWAQFQRPYKHRLPEGAMSCVDCHNPHGSFLPRNMRTVAGNERSCFRCHGNLRGPFTYEHAPVQLGNCSQCHEPHGSANPRMLVRHEVRFLCLECHSNIGATTQALGGIPPAFHDLRNPRFQNCTICHMKVHGSYVSPALTR